MKRDLITLLNFSLEDIQENIALTKRLKHHPSEKGFDSLLKGKSYAMIFHKKSLRTRLSFEVAINKLGGHPINMSEKEISIGKRESIEDVARAMSRYVDGILIRTFEHQTVEQLAQHATVPVVNMLTDYCHPCQVLSDAYTIHEHFGRLENLKLVYLGDGNNVAHSWLNLACRVPLNLWIATAPETMPDPNLVKTAQQAGISEVHIVHDAQSAIEGANVLYTDVWASMGQKDQFKTKSDLLNKMQVNQQLVEQASEDVIVMHCLPAERGNEITAEVLDGPKSIVWDQAENRMHTQKAIMVQLERWRNS